MKKPATRLTDAKRLRLCATCGKDISDRGSAARFCIDCCEKRHRMFSDKWIENHWEEHLKSSRESKKRHPEKNIISKHNWNIKNQKKKNILSQSEKMKEWHREYVKNPEVREKNLARWKTHKKIKKLGICNKCGFQGSTQFHHTSYKPNISVELCKRCHYKEHGGRF